MADETIPFHEWMRRALFDPERGYYSRQIRTVGRRGDFSTSATVSTALGEAIACWLRQERAAQPEVRTVIEVGGGSGDLMQSVRQAFGWWGRRSWRFLMVETSPVLRHAQQEKLAGAGVQWFEDLPRALQACEGKAFLYHNELLDAFPVTLVEWNTTEKVWREIWLEIKEGKWQEQLRLLDANLHDSKDFSALDSWNPPYDRQRCELGMAARDWLREWAPHWHAGAMLTLDYGDAFPQLYRRQPMGTLRAYQHHQRFSGPEIYEQMGRRDLTADVNFTDLQRWGTALGWQAGPLRTQRAFLQAQLKNLDRRAAKDPALSFLLDEHGAGEAFRVLVQRPIARRSANSKYQC